MGVPVSVYSLGHFVRARASLSLSLYCSLFFGIWLFWDLGSLDLREHFACKLLASLLTVVDKFNEPSILQ